MRCRLFGHRWTYFYTNGFDPAFDGMVRMKHTGCARRRCPATKTPQVEFHYFDLSK